MQKIVIPLFVVSLILSACSAVDCPLNNTVYSVYQLKKANGMADTLTDTLSVITLMHNEKEDPVLINRDTKVTSFNVAMSYSGSEDILYFLIRAPRTKKDTIVSGNDTTITEKNYLVELLDTVVVGKENHKHFESVECTPSFFHTITGVRHTKNAIDSIVIHNREVNYDSSKEHFHLYLKSGY